MLQVRTAKERGFADHGWLKAAHTFSFADYYDPDNMHFRSLRVINEDRVAGGAGFPTHAHRDMEIITFIISGALEHRDSMENTAVIYPGEVQRMSAGTGVKHSEFNHQQDKETHLLQIWLLPAKEGIEPSYEQKSFKEEFQNKKLVLVVSPQAENGSLKIHQDAKLSIGNLKSGDQISYEIADGRYVWIQMVRGSMAVNGQAIKASDGLAVSKEKTLQITADQETQFLLFDLS